MTITASTNNCKYGLLGLQKVGLKLVFALDTVYLPLQCTPQFQVGDRNERRRIALRRSSEQPTRLS